MPTLSVWGSVGFSTPQLFSSPPSVHIGEGTCQQIDWISCWTSTWETRMRCLRHAPQYLISRSLGPLLHLTLGKGHFLLQRKLLFLWSMTLRGQQGLKLDIQRDDWVTVLFTILSKTSKILWGVNGLLS